MPGCPMCGYDYIEAKHRLQRPDDPFCIGDSVHIIQTNKIGRIIGITNRDKEPFTLVSVMIPHKSGNFFLENLVPDVLERILDFFLQIEITDKHLRIIEQSRRGNILAWNNDRFRASNGFYLISSNHIESFDDALYVRGRNRGKDFDWIPIPSETWLKTCLEAIKQYNVFMGISQIYRS